MKPQDVLVALVLAVAEEAAERADGVPTYADLAARVGVSASQAHAAVRRLQDARLVDARRRVRRSVLLDFLAHGLQRTFPARPGGVAMGVPTGAAKLSESGFPVPELAPWVWPHGAGQTRGLALEPLYSSAPDAALRDPELYELLALADLIRAGNSREVERATGLLREALSAGSTSSRPILDLGSHRALAAIFSRERIERSIRKWCNEPADDALVRHPLERAILTQYSQELAERLSSSVPAGSWTAGPAYHVTADKGAGTRDLSYPSLIDALVGRRTIDELEPVIRRNDGERVFTMHRRSSSRLPTRTYERWFDEWSRFVQSTLGSSRDLQMAYILESDVAEFYPSIDLADARQAVARRTDANPEVISLLFHCLASWRPRVGFRAQGGLPLDPHDVSSLVAHCVLESVDETFRDSFELMYRRFVDDTVMLVPDEAHADRRRREHQRALAAIGLRQNARKTRVVPVAEYEDSLRQEDLREIGEARRAPGELARVTRRWLRQFRGKKLGDLEESGDGRVLRRLYSANAGRRDGGLDARAPEDLEHPAYRHNVLKYLTSTALDQQRAAELWSAFASEPSSLPAKRIAIARGLLNATYEDPDGADPIVEQAIRWIYGAHQAPGHGYAAGLLLLFAFKHHPQLLPPGLDEWIQSTPPLLADPYLSLIYGYALRGAGRPCPIPIRLDEGRDAALTHRLCEDAEQGALRHLERILQTCLVHPKDRRIGAESLPLVYMIVRGARGEAAATVEHWLTRRSGQRRRDRAHQRHVEALRSHLSR